MLYFSNSEVTLIAVPFEELVTSNTPFIINNLCFTFLPVGARIHSSPPYSLLLSFCLLIAADTDPNPPSSVENVRIMTPLQWYYKRQHSFLSLMIIWFQDFLNNTDKSCQAIGAPLSHIINRWESSAKSFSFVIDLTWDNLLITHLTEKKGLWIPPRIMSYPCKGAINIQSPSIHFKVRLAV